MGSSAAGTDQSATLPDKLLEGTTVRYRVTLDPSERVQLVSMVVGGKAAVRKVKRAQILWAADAGSTDEEIASRLLVL